MAGFADVVLRGLVLTCVSLAVGGIAWTRLVLGAEPHAKPGRPAQLALRTTAVAAWLAALGQGAVLAVALGELARLHGEWPLGPFFETTFARVGLARMALGTVVGALAWTLGRRAAGPGPWAALTVAGLALVASSAVLSHAVARVDGRLLLLALDAAHQLAAAVWIGGLAHLTVHAVGGGQDADPDGEVERRFSSLALAGVTALAATGAVMTYVYVGDVGGLVGTAYGVMILSKGALFAVTLWLGWANFRVVRAARQAGTRLRLARYVEVELGLGMTVLFAAASLTSLPPAVDVTTDRATLAEVGARFVPAAPRLVSPPVDELIRVADPLMAPPNERRQIEREWSEYNHHWAGLVVLAMGLLAAAERLGVRWARHWPLLFLGLAVFLFIRNDPRAWPLGPAGFWESFALPDVLQHRLFVVMIVAFAVFEWRVRTGRLPARPWAYVFPLLCAVGGGLLLTHSHAMFNLKDEFLTEVTHAPLGILGAFTGWARWLEVRLPVPGATAGWVWRTCLIAVGLLLLFYRET